MSENTVRGASLKKKLIEVALPLDAINKAAVAEKNIRGLPLPVWISARNGPTPSTAWDSRFQS